MPPLPDGDLCTIDIVEQRALCINIPNPDPKNDKDVMFSDMDKWLAVSPQTWKNFQEYIAKLKELAVQRCR